MLIIFLAASERVRYIIVTRHVMDKSLIRSCYKRFRTRDGYSETPRTDALRSMARHPVKYAHIWSLR